MALPDGSSIYAAAAVLGVAAHIGYFNRFECHMYAVRYLQLFTLSCIGGVVALMNLEGLSIAQAASTVAAHWTQVDNDFVSCDLCPGSSFKNKDVKDHLQKKHSSLFLPRVQNPSEMGNDSMPRDQDRVSSRDGTGSELVHSPYSEASPMISQAF